MSFTVRQISDAIAASFGQSGPAADAIFARVKGAAQTGLLGHAATPGAGRPRRLELGEAAFACCLQVLRDYGVERGPAMEIRPGFHVAALPETLAAIREGEDFDLALAFVHIIAPGQPVRAGIRAAWCRPITLPDWSPYEPETRGRPALGNVHTAFVARWPISATLCPFLHCLEPDDQ